MNFGFGIPWPIPHSMDSSPFSFLFASSRPYHSLGIFLVFHVFFMVFCIWQMGNLLNFKRVTNSVLVFSVTLASQLEYLVSSDAAAAFLGWALLPGLILGVFKIGLSKSTRDLLLWGSFLSLVIAYGLGNSHLGMFSTYLASVCILFICLSYRSKPKLFTGGCVLATSILVSANKLFLFFTEWSKYSKGVIREQYDYNSSASHTLWSIFLKPFTIQSPFNVNLTDFLIFFTQSNQVTRVLSFGSPFVVLVLIIGFYRSFISRKQSLILKDYSKVGQTSSKFTSVLWLNFALCCIIQFIPARFLSDIVSASWTFRDPATIYGMILFCYYIDRYSKNRPTSFYFHLSILFHILCVFVASLCVVVGTSILNNSNDWTASQYDELFASSLTNSKWPGISLLDNALHCESIDCEKFGTRIAMSGLVSNYLARGELKNSGLILNLLGTKGWEEVNAVTKGISQDLIHTSQAKFYGMISSNSYQSFGYIPNQYDWLLQNAALRNLTGIRVVLARSDETIDLHGLSLVGKFSADNDRAEIYVYRNLDALPKVILLSAIPVSVRNELACPISRAHTLTCQRIVLAKMRLYPDPIISSKSIGNGFSITISPRSQDSYLLVNTMWDKSWSSNVGSLKNFNGLILLHVPSSTQVINLEYTTKWKAYINYISSITMLLLFLTLLSSLIQNPLNRAYLVFRNKVKSPDNK